MIALELRRLGRVQAILPVFLGVENDDGTFEEFDFNSISNVKNVKSEKTMLQAQEHLAVILNIEEYTIDPAVTTWVADHSMHPNITFCSR